MRKILIVTVYGSYNHGSYLQAKALGEKLKNHGEVSFFESNTRKWKVIYTALKRAKYFCRNAKNPIKIISVGVYELIEAFKLHRLWKKLPNTEDSDSHDLIVLGSDEIWNLSRKECRFPVFWGHGFKQSKISYAPSLNNSTYDDFEMFPEYVQYLNKIDCISVRDLSSKKILEKFTNKEISIVLDPTLLSSPKEYHIKESKPYIAVYSFDAHISDSEQKKIVEFARSEKLNLVSVGQNVMWCDKCVHSKNGNPFYIFKNARYVITSTFHGTAYAINYNTEFIAFCKENDKVENLLREFELTERIFNSENGIEGILSKKIDYKKVNEMLQKKRHIAENYIKLALKSNS